VKLVVVPFNAPGCLGRVGSRPGALPGLIDRDVVEEAALAVRRAVEPDALHQAGVLAPQLAELIVSHGDEKILESHRREIVVVFCRVTRLLQLHAPKGPLSHARLPGQEARVKGGRSLTRHFALALRLRSGRGTISAVTLPPIQ